MMGYTSMFLNIVLFRYYLNGISPPAMGGHYVFFLFFFIERL
ncbi:hypothetical protein FOPPYZMZ_CDS0400 [Pseudomonas phage 9Ps-7B]|nr:hypothetical protein [Pseudomonas phage ANB1]WNV50439.1 hypothetical protein [Pseudomonas phage PhiPizzaParty]WRQ05835.1 hypothetical protein IPCDMZAV_CDS0312 [Pseudomonas phage 6B]WRQ06332.1 hypothetical protein QAMIJHJT_CDS0401 [Pseudomonas phage 9-Ps-8B]WRQ06740.1 hypothetical protein FOPPYZMZ_CDS0400 [Pseudomonas phage 9Ps-7B]WRQ07091.1 hypothetical protein ZBUARNPM_CDS0342 [Pseudomonas phage 14Ps5-6]